MSTLSELYEELSDGEDPESKEVSLVFILRDVLGLRTHLLWIG